jgi:hypothetical protein
MATKKQEPAQKPDAQEDDGLVAMAKDGEVLRVHPTCVKSHQAAGWKLVG